MSENRRGDFLYMSPTSPIYTLYRRWTPIELCISERCHETPHRAHRTATRRARRVTGRFAPSSVLPFTYLTFPAYFSAYSVKTQASSSGCFNYISARCARCTRCARCSVSWHSFL